MKLLALDSSAKTASVAVTEQGVLRSEAFVHVPLTHSETLLPMLLSALQNAKLELEEIDAFAVTVGPGSFTGLRIAIAAVKGLALPRNLPCAGVSTLESMAYALLGRHCIACGVMDARCGQLYASVFECGETICRLIPDSAIRIEDLPVLLAPYGGVDIVLLGDGAELCRELYGAKIPRLELAPQQLRFQRAAGAAFAAENAGVFIPAQDLQPVYLRLPQAERELQKRTER